MSEFTVAVNDPAYPPGTEISVTGVRVMFKNGEVHTVTEADLDPNVVTDVKDALSFVAGFTVSDGVPQYAAPADAPVGFVPEEVAAEITSNEGGVN